jgi:predicted dehydrogenase
VMSDTAAHTQDVLAAFAHGKPVLIDKPLAVSKGEAKDLVEAAALGGLPLAVAFHIRYAPPYLRAKQLIDEGVIGTPLTMRIAIRVPLDYVMDEPGASSPGWYADPVRAGGGGFLDHAVHYADAMRFLLGTEAATVSAVVGNLAHPDLAVDDYGVAIVTTDAGQVVTIESTWHAPGWYSPESSAEECVIVGTSGELVIRYHGEPQLEYSANGIDGRVSETWTGDDRGPIAYVRMVEEFVRIVRDGGAPTASGADGLEATRIIEAAYDSARVGAAISLQPEGTK